MMKAQISLSEVGKKKPHTQKQHRISQACTFCAKRKIKCNGTYPCNNCTTYHQDCCYATPKKRGRPFRKTESLSQPKFTKIPVSTLLCDSPEASPVSSRHSDEFVSDEAVAKSQWTHERFATFTLPDNDGNVAFWLDLYYRKMHSLLGIMTRRIVDHHFYDFPPVLYHAMLATCYDRSNLPKEVFESHYEVASERHSNVAGSLYDVLIDIHIFAFHYIHNQIDPAMLTIMKILTTCRLMGLPHCVTRTTCLPPELEHELGSRSWIYLYMVDFFSSSFLKLPCVIQENVPAHMLQFFTNNAYSNTQYPPDTQIPYAFYFVPLMSIGKRQLAGEKSEGKTKGLMAELDEWVLNLPKLSPFPDHSVTKQREGTFWDTYLLAMFHYIYLTVLKDEFIDLIGRGVEQHETLDICERHARQLNRLIKGTLINYDQLNNLPGMMGRCIFVGGVFQCVLGLTNTKFLQLVVDHIALLDSVTHMSKLLATASDDLSRFMKNPLEALDFLRKLF